MDSLGKPGAERKENPPPKVTIPSHPVPSCPVPSHSVPSHPIRPVRGCLSCLFSRGFLQTTCSESCSDFIPASPCVAARPLPVGSLRSSSDCLAQSRASLQEAPARDSALLQRLGLVSGVPIVRGLSRPYLGCLGLCPGLQSPGSGPSSTLQPGPGPCSSNSPTRLSLGTT